MRHAKAKGLRFMTLETLHCRKPWSSKNCGRKYNSAALVILGTTVFNMSNQFDAHALTSFRRHGLSGAGAVLAHTALRLRHSSGTCGSAQVGVGTDRSFTLAHTRNRTTGPELEVRRRSYLSCFCSTSLAFIRYPRE